MEVMKTLDPKMVQETADYLDLVKSIEVKDQESLELAGSVLADLKSARKKREAFFKPMKDAANAAKQAILDRENEAIDPIKEMEGVLNGKIDVFATAIRKAEEEERKRLEIEAAKKADEERKALMDKAVAEEAKGNKAAAEIILEEAEKVYTAPVVIEPTVQKTSRMGTSTMTLVEDYEFEITDQKALISAVHAGIIPNENVVVTLKLVTLKAWVKANKITSAPGISIRKVTGTSLRGAKR